MPERKLVVEIVGDSRQLEQTFAKSSKAAAQFGNQSSASLGKAQKSFASFGQAATAGLAFGGAAAAGVLISKTLKDSITTASNLNEQISKSRQVFGGSSREIEDWAKTTANSIGIANDQALEATGTFGGLFTVVGFGQAPAAAMSKQMVQLAADMASFNNASPEETLLALRSGLAGEAEPLRRFQVFLSEARVQQQAFADTGKTSAKSLTNQEKALARYEIILKDTAKQQGDYARTSEGLANKQRTLTANLRDLEAQIGGGLIPVMSDATNVAIGFSEVLQKIGKKDIPVVGKSSGFLKGFAQGFFLPIGALHALSVGIDALRDKPVQVDVRGEEDIVAALNTVDAIKDAVFGGIPVIFNVQTQGLAAATSEIESLRSTTTTTLGDVWTAPAGKSPEDMTKQRNAWFDAAIGRKQDRAQNIDNLRAQNAALAKIAAEIQARLDKTKDVTRRLRLEDDLFAVERTIAQNRKQIAADTLAASREAHAKMLEALKKQKETQERIAQERKDALRRRQFRALGLTAEGEEAVPQIPNLQKRAAQLKARLASTGKLTPAILATFKKIARAIKIGGKDTSREIRAAIDRMLKEISDSLQGKGKAGPITKGRVANIDKLLDDIGLSPEQKRALKDRFSGIGPTTRVSTGGGAGARGRPFGGGTGPVVQQGGIVITGPVTVVSNDPDQFHRQLQRKARRKGTQTTGPHAGNSMGHTR